MQQAFALKGGRERASWNIHNLWLDLWQLQLISNSYLSKAAELARGNLKSFLKGGMEGGKKLAWLIPNMQKF